MSRKWLILPVFFIAAFLSGCVGKSDTSTKGESISLSEEPVSSSDTEGRHETENGTENEAAASPQVLQISNVQETINYKGETPFHYIAASGEGNIYLSARDQGNGSCLLKMKEGDSQAEKMPVEVPAGMEFAHLAVDRMNNLYAIVINKGNSRNCEIWKINKDGEVADRFDISDDMQEEDWYPWAFAVAGNGDMYLRIGGLDGILALVFDNKGNFLNSISDEGKYQLIDAVGRGKDGEIYAVLQDTEDRQLIARLDGREGRVDDIYEDILPKGQGMFACVGEGTDSDLIVYGPGAGIFAYDLKQKEVKRHIPASRLPFGMDSGCKSTVLSDGRMLFVERGITTENGTVLSTAEGTVFYYIPFGQ